MKRKKDYKLILFSVAGLILLSTMSLVSFGHADIALQQNPDFKIKVNLGVKVAFKIDENIDGTFSTRTLVLNISSVTPMAIGGQYYDNLNITKLLLSGGVYYDDPARGVSYRFNTSTTPYWQFGDISAAEEFSIYAALLLPLNASNNQFDENYWANVMAFQGGLPNTYAALNFTEVYVASNEIRLFNSTTGHYCNMTFNPDNGTLVTGRFYHHVKVGGTYVELRQEYIRLMDYQFQEEKKDDAIPGFPLEFLIGSVGIATFIVGKKYLRRVKV